MERVWNWYDRRDMSIASNTARLVMCESSLVLKPDVWLNVLHTHVHTSQRETETDREKSTFISAARGRERSLIWVRNPRLSVQVRTESLCIWGPLLVKRYNSLPPSARCRNQLHARWQVWELFAKIKQLWYHLMNASLLDAKLHSKCFTRLCNSAVDGHGSYPHF